MHFKATLLSLSIAATLPSFSLSLLRHYTSTPLYRMPLKFSKVILGWRLA